MTATALRREGSGMDLKLDTAQAMANDCLRIGRYGPQAADRRRAGCGRPSEGAAASGRHGTLRREVAKGKASGAIALGMGSRGIFERAKEQPYFIQSVNALAGGSLVPVPGGVLIRKDGEIIGAVGITGDSSDNDEACASRAIEAAGLTADGG